MRMGKRLFQQNRPGTDSWPASAHGRLHSYCCHSGAASYSNGLWSAVRPSAQRWQLGTGQIESDRPALKAQFLKLRGLPAAGRLRMGHEGTPGRKPGVAMTTRISRRGSHCAALSSHKALSLLIEDRDTNGQCDSGIRTSFGPTQGATVSKDELIRESQTWPESAGPCDAGSPGIDKRPAGPYDFTSAWAAIDLADTNHDLACSEFGGKCNDGFWLKRFGDVTE